jgi:DNA-directed RNA polymerase sigma subunit (sigma70/sigma32)
MEGMKNIGDDDLSTLTPHEAEVLRMLCGLDMAARSTKEVALYFAITTDAVEEVKTAALRKLRQPILRLV